MEKVTALKDWKARPKVEGLDAEWQEVEGHDAAEALRRQVKANEEKKRKQAEERKRQAQDLADTLKRR